MTSGTINTFISRVGTALPQFSVNASTSRFIAPYPKIIIVRLFFDLLAKIHDLKKIYYSNENQTKKLEGVTKLAPAVAYSVVEVAALYLNLNPYFRTLLFLGRQSITNLQCINRSNSLNKNFGLCCFLVKEVAGIIFMFRPTATWLTIRVGARILGRLVETELFCFDMQRNKDANTMRNWCFKVVLPTVADTILANDEIKILLNK